MYPLHLASFWNMPKHVCAYLIDKGADPFLKNKRCSNAFYTSLSNHHPDVLDLYKDMLTYEPDPVSGVVKPTADFIDFSLFVVACNPTSPSDIGIFEKLKELGFNINESETYPPLINLFCSSRGTNQQDYYKSQVSIWLMNTEMQIHLW